MSFGSNNVFGYQESLRKIMKVIVKNFSLILKTEKKNPIQIKTKKLDAFFLKKKISIVDMEFLKCKIIFLK